jgi:hypothetical protein
MLSYMNQSQQQLRVHPLLGSLVDPITPGIGYGGFTGYGTVPGAGLGVGPGAGYGYGTNPGLGYGGVPSAYDSGIYGGGYVQPYTPGYSPGYSLGYGVQPGYGTALPGV